MNDGSKRPVSLRDRILKAGNFEEMRTLQQEGEGYEYATKGTRGKWRRAVSATLRRLADQREAR